MSELTLSTQQPDRANPRSRIINSYLTTIDNSILENRSHIKLVNYGTGSGKTHQLFQAICETIRKYPDRQLIGVYVAPLREHLKVPASILIQYPDIPVYTLYSLEMKTTDEFIRAYKTWVPAVLANKEFWKTSSKKFQKDKIQETRKNLNNAKNVISRLEYVKKTDFGDHKFNTEQVTKAIRDLNDSLEKFLEFFIKCELNESDWPDECLKLIEIFYPIHLLGEKSGILMLTYDKFETHVPYFKHNGESWIKKTAPFDSYIINHSNSTKKFILAFDEQEDGYQIMLKHKIDIIAPEKLAINNALSSINREFSVLFSSDSHDNRAFLRFLEDNPGAFGEFKEHFEKGKTIEPDLVRLAPLYARLTTGEGNSINFVKQLVSLNRGLANALREITGVFDTSNASNPVVLDFLMLSRVFSIFENNRSLLISRKLYSKISHDLMNIFAYNNLYIYNIEPLKTLFLSKSSGGHVHIVENKSGESTSVAELIYAILASRQQITKVQEFLTNVLNADDSQSRSLDIWSNQIERVQKAGGDSISQDYPIKYLSRIYVYQSYKSIINIREIARYQYPTNNLIDPLLREISIGSTAILSSPEHRIVSMLANNANVIFLISATGGVIGDLSTSYDMRYLEDTLRNETGRSSFEVMKDSEILLCEEIRDHRHSSRTVACRFFDTHAGSFPNMKTQEVMRLFEKLVLKAFIESLSENGIWLGIYKIQELQNFVRFLFFLFEDDLLQETIAFTQTISWIKQLIYYGEKLHHAQFVFEASAEHPNIYYFRSKHPKYINDARIKIILYEAAFNSLYYNKTVEKTYLDELSEANGEKIFFISAYKSASKGLNPIIKKQDGQEKDFDSLVLLMDSYYTEMGPVISQSKDSGQSATQFQFALMKSIVHLGDSSVEIKDFNKYLSRPEAREFQEQQHQILLGKAILQSIGRTERRDFEKQVVKIFINEETRKNLVNFYRYLNREEPDEIRKLSVNNFQVYLAVQEEERKRTIQNYDEHVYDEVNAYLIFQSFREKMLKDIELLHLDNKTNAVVRAWDAIRDPIVFTDPARYIDKLRMSGLFPEGFPESMFYHNPAQPEFTPYLASMEEQGKKFSIISDSTNGERVYPYLNRLFPEYLKANARGFDLEGNEVLSMNPSTDAIYRLYRLLLPQPEIFRTYIPRPQFFYDVLYPSLAENFTERWIQDVIFHGKDWKTIKSLYGFEPLQDFSTYNGVYELFDLFYIRENVLFCIDVKAWSLTSGNRLSEKTLIKAQKKLETIAATYPEFCLVRGLLLNLHAPEEKIHQYSSSLFSGNLIYADDYRFPAASSILNDFLFQKEK